MGPGGIVLFLIFAFGALSPTVAAAQEAPPAAPALEWRARLVEVPAPNLERVDPAVRRQLEGMGRVVDQLLSHEGTSQEELAEAFGRLGQLYSLYGLLDAGEGAFRNALALAPQDFRWNYYLGTIDQEYRRLDEAVERYEAALRARPDDLPSLIRLGRVELARDRPEEAGRWFQRALALDPSSAAARYGLGQVAYARGDLQEAIEHFEAALEAQPRASVIHYQLGLAYRDLGDLEKAREHLARRGEQEVQFPDPLIDGLARLATGAGIFIERGTRAYTRGRYDIAVEAYRRALAEDPDNLTARQALASALAQVEEVDAAVAEFREVLRRDPDNAISHYNLATLLARQGADAEALEHFRRAVELAPDFADAHFNLAMAHTRAGRHDEALTHFARAVELNPQDATARLQWALALRRTGRRDRALEELQTLVAADPRNAEALVALGTVLTDLGREEEALARYRRALELAPDETTQGMAHLQLGRLLVARDGVEEGIDHLRSAAGLLPEAVDAHLALANALGRLGRYQEAAVHFQEVLKLDPENQGARFGRGISLLLAEQYQEAKVHFEESLKLAPESPPLKHALARLLATCPDPEVRDGERALELAFQVLRADPSLDHAETVAMAYAELERFEEAVEWQRRVLDQATRTGRTDVLPRVRARLALYQEGKPCRAPWLGEC